MTNNKPIPPPPSPPPSRYLREGEEPTKPIPPPTKMITEGIKPGNDNLLTTISVYIDDGRIFQYEVEGPSKVREHSAAIIKDGYRHNDGLVFEHYPPFRILKVKANNIPTNYPDRTVGT